MEPPHAIFYSRNVHSRVLRAGYEVSDNVLHKQAGTTSQWQRAGLLPRPSPQCSRQAGDTPTVTENGESNGGIVESQPEARHTAKGGSSGKGFHVVPTEGDGDRGGLGLRGANMVL